LSILDSELLALFCPLPYFFYGEMRYIRIVFDQPLGERTPRLTRDIDLSDIWGATIGEVEVRLYTEVKRPFLKR